MALGIKNIAAIVGLSLAGTGAVAGIGYGIHAATTMQHSSEEEFHKIPEKKPDTSNPNKPIENNTQNKPADTDKEANDDPLVTTVKLQDYKQKLDQKNIVFKRLQTSGGDVTVTEENIDKTKIFSYEIKPLQIKYENKGEIPNDIQIKLEIDSSKRDIATYSKGVMGLKVTLSKMDETFEFDLDVEGFKKSDEKLNKLLSNVDGDSFVLDLSKQKDSSTKYLTVEELNTTHKQITLPKKASEGDVKKDATGLTSLFWTTNFDDKDLGELFIGDYKIQGGVKLAEIKTTEDTASYVLTSDKKDDFLKIIKLEGDEKESEAVLVNKIVVNELLPTSVSLTPKLKEVKQNTKLLEAIKTDSKTHKNYYSKSLDDNNKIEDGNLWINVNKNDQTPIKRLNLVGFSIKEEELKAGKLPLEIKLSFGTGNEAKTYSNEKDEELLKALGYGFDLLSKKVGMQEEELDGSELRKEEHSLSTYFDPAKLNKFEARQELNDPKETNKTTKTGSYYLETFDANKLKNIEVNLQESIGPNIHDISTQTPINFIVFVGYTNKKNEGSSKNMVCYLPYAILVHVAKAVEKAK